MKKLIGLAITAAVVLSPASPAFADRGDREDNRRASRRSSSCTAELAVLTRTVSLQALCGGERSEDTRRSNRRSSSCTADLGVTRSVSLQALCSGR